MLVGKIVTSIVCWTHFGTFNGFINYPKAEPPGNVSCTLAQNIQIQKRKHSSHKCFQSTGKTKNN